MAFTTLNSFSKNIKYPAIHNLNQGSQTTAIDATGTSNTIVVFNSSGTLNLTAKTTVTTINYLIVAGGGGGGGFYSASGSTQQSGGGGAGGYILGKVILSPGYYDIFVGLGGAKGSNGQMSSFIGKIAIGGAAPPTETSYNVFSSPGIGGSGGGGTSVYTGSFNLTNPGAGTISQGYGGGKALANGTKRIGAAAGGGGATSVGGSANTSTYATGKGGTGITINSINLEGFPGTSVFCTGGDGGSTTLVTVASNTGNGGNGSTNKLLNPTAGGSGKVIITYI